MRVLFVNQYYDPDHAATAQMLTDLAEDLAARGWSVSVIASRTRYSGPDPDTPGLAAFEIRRGVRVHRVSVIEADRARIASRILGYLSFHASALVRLLRLPRFDVVVFLTDPPMLPLLGFPARWVKRSRVAIWAQDLYPDLLFRLGYLPERGLLGWAGRFLMRRALRRADRVFALGRCMADALRDQGAPADRIVVQRHWSDLKADTADSSNPNRFREGIGGEFLVMYSGNLGMAHSLEEIRAALRFFKDRPEIRFVFIGGGHRQAELAAFVEAEGLKNVDLFPYQPRAKLAETLGAADVHLVTMKAGFEGLIVPSKLYGIMAASRPAIYAGPAESETARMIEETGCGWRVEPGDSAGLISAIEAAKADGPEARAKGRRGRNCFDSHLARHLGTARLSKELTSIRRRPAGEGWPKRFFDVVLSSVGLIASAPLWLVFGGLVRMEDGGPVFFRDRRVGRGGRDFSLLKFRTMVEDADGRFGVFPAGDKDPRVTRIGRRLRSTAMDELPQLWNIFKGDLSFVGPRALRLKETASDQAEVPGFQDRYAVRPGLTGLAQIYADRNARRSAKLRFDILYIRRRSLWLDLKLILLSFWITFRGRWEARPQKNAGRLKR